MDTLKTNKQEILAMSSEERKDALRLINKTLNHSFRQKLMLGIIVISGGKMSVSEYMEGGFTLVLLLPVTLIMFAFALFFLKWQVPFHASRNVLRQLLQYLLR